MPEIVNFNEINKSEIVRRIKDGDLFIYPTDTVYGLGCNAMKQGSVQLKNLFLLLLQINSGYVKILKLLIKIL